MKSCLKITLYLYYLWMILLKLCSVCIWSYFVQIVQSSLGAILPPSWLSEKSILQKIILEYIRSLFCTNLWLGKGTIPGSVKTALACAMNNKNIIMLNMITWKLPHKLPDIVWSTIHLKWNIFKYLFFILKRKSELVSGLRTFWIVLKFKRHNIEGLQV